jgi:ABC-2 type transport system permease protein
LEWTQALGRISPNILFNEALTAVLSPDTRSLGPIFLSQLQGAVIGAPLPLAQSLMLAWPQAVSLIAGTIVLFVIGYVSFQRQEVRA